MLYGWLQHQQQQPRHGATCRCTCGHTAEAHGWTVESLFVTDELPCASCKCSDFWCDS